MNTGLGIAPVVVAALISAGTAIYQGISSSRQAKKANKAAQSEAEKAAEQQALQDAKIKAIQDYYAEQDKQSQINAVKQQEQLNKILIYAGIAGLIFCGVAIIKKK